MSLRALWIFFRSTPEHGQDKVVFSRYYSTVERRSSLIHDNHILIPDESILCNNLIRSLGIRKGTNSIIEEFDPQRDSCCIVQSKPVYDVPVGEDTSLWPVVAIEKFGLIFACLPLVEQDLSTGRVPLVELPGVTIGYKLLHSLAEYTGIWSSPNELLARMKDLQSFLAVAVPFGTPVDTNPNTVQALISGKEVLNPQVRKQPAWKPTSHKGKQQLVFSIKEEIRAAQHQADSTKDVYQLFGTIVCKAEIDGIPEITVNITSSMLDYLIVHPSVHEGNTHTQDLMQNQDLTPPGTVGRRIRFRPPVEFFTLCHYSAQPTNGLPIEGIYQMKGDERAVQIILQLKLNSRVRNSFEFCEIHLPFYNRGPIVKVESSGPSHGSLMVVSDKRKLALNIGQKFPKSLQVSFSGTVFFDNLDTTQTGQSTLIEDPFCQGLSSYAQVYFKMNDFALTGCKIDPRSLTIYPNTKISKLHTSIEFTTSDYKIWNTFGDALVMQDPSAADE